MPALNRQQIQRVIRANRAFKQYRQYQADLDDSDDDEGPDNDDAWLFEDLSVLLKLMIKKKEKEGFLALIFEVGVDRIYRSAQPADLSTIDLRVPLRSC
jgi:hypothetical protein